MIIHFSSMIKSKHIALALDEATDKGLTRFSGISERCSGIALDDESIHQELSESLSFLDASS